MNFRDLFSVPVFDILLTCMNSFMNSKDEFQELFEKKNFPSNGSCNLIFLVILKKMLFEQLRFIIGSMSKHANIFISGVHTYYTNSFISYTYSFSLLNVSDNMYL